MNHAEIRRSLSQGIRSTLLRQASLPKQPRPFQVETFESCVRWLDNPDGTRRAYVSHATGLGKTILFAIIVASAPELRSLIIVPTKALLEQTARKVVQFTGGLLGHLSSLSDIQDEAGEDVIAVRGLDHSSVVLTTDASFNKLAARIRAQFDPHLIIRDECHWGYVGPALAALDQFSEAVVIGFSATPDYLTSKAKDGYLPVELENGRTLYGPRDRFAETHFQTCLDRRTVRWGIESGWLAPLAWGFVEFDVSLKNIPVVDTADGPDYQPDKLQELMGKHWTVMCETIRRLYEKGDYDLPNRQVFAVCPSVLAAQELAEAIASLGISSACITGASTTLERNVILPAFNESEIRFLTSVMVLREGWDAPNAEVCMMLRPTVSRVLYEQPMGRVLRLSEKNPNKVALVLDAHFQGKKLCPLSAPAIYGKPGDEIHVGAVLLGPRADNGEGDFTVSPYLPKNADPRIVVVDMLENDIEREHRAGPDGTFEADGETWITIIGFSQRCGLSCSGISGRVRSCRTSAGRNRAGKRVRFYALSDVQKACADLLQDLPQAGEDGFFEADGETWGSLYALRDKTRLSGPTLKIKMALTPWRSREGIGRRGRVITFYALSDVQKACADLLQDLPQAGEDGFFEADGETWGSLSAWGKRLHTSGRAVGKRMTSSESRKGKDLAGHVGIFYALSDIQKFCGDLSQDLQKSGEDGFIEADGETWGTVTALCGRLGTSFNSIQGRVSSCRSRQAKSRAGSTSTFYALSDVQKACADLLQDLPQAGEDGFFEADGETWGTAVRLAPKFSVSKTTLMSHLTACRSRAGRNTIGHRLTFYALSDVQKACADLLQDLPQAGEDGFFEADGETWGTVCAMADRMKISEPAILSRASACRRRDGRDRSGKKSARFYALSDVQKACADLLQDLPQAGEDGFFEADGETWGTAEALSRRLKVCARTVKDRTTHCKSRQGKDSGGRIATFYSFADIRQTFVDRAKRKRRTPESPEPTVP